MWIHATPPARKPRRITLNDDDRQQWCDNDEGLYYWQRSSALSRRDFIRANRAEIDAVILKALNQEPVS